MLRSLIINSANSALSLELSRSVSLVLSSNIEAESADADSDLDSLSCFKDFFSVQLKSANKSELAAKSIVTEGCMVVIIVDHVGVSLAIWQALPWDHGNGGVKF